MAKFNMLVLLALMVALAFAQIPNGPLHAMVRGRATTINGTSITPVTTPTGTISVTGGFGTNTPCTNTSASYYRSISKTVAGSDPHSITKTITGSHYRSITKTITGPVDPNTTITLAPTTLKTMLEKKAPAADACHLTTLYGGQDVIVTQVCDAYTIICQECVGCNAPVTVCSAV